MAAIEQLARYVPKRILRTLAGADHSQALPQIDRYRAAILFADISGFTQLTDQLGRQGQEGTEELADILNGYFGTLLGYMNRHGGDILKMAGDALVVAWEGATPAEMRMALRRAMQCAWEIQQDDTPQPDGAHLTVKIGIAMGDAELYYIGGMDHRWEVWPMGEPFRQMGVAEGHAKPGEVTVSPEAWKEAGAFALGTLLEGGCVRLEGIPEAQACERARPLDFRKVGRETVEDFAPKPVRYLLQDVGETWLADMRPVTCLFVHVPARVGEPPLGQMQELAAITQKAVHRFEGSIICAGVDEKGLSVFAAFGLPPNSHEDEPLRATQAALAIRQAVVAGELEVGIGIATGRVFCGTIGNDERRDYAVLGSTVNLAARLSHASHNRIFCDATTAEEAGERAQFESAPPLHLKGFANEVAVSIPTGLAAPAKAAEVKLVGHRAELALLAEAEGRVKKGVGSLIILEGEPGIGKSTLLKKWTREAAANGMRVLVGGAESIHATTPYHVWRPILGGLLGLSDTAPEDDRRAKFLSIARGQHWEWLAPLLDAILELDLPDNSITGQIRGGIRADNLRQLVSTLIAEQSAKGPLAIVLEDGHWMDSASLALATVVAQRSQPLVLVLSSRILTGEREHFLDPLMALGIARRLRLDTLAGEDCVSLAAHRLGVDSIAPSIAKLIMAKSQGNPFFSIEIAFALKEQGLVTLAGGECRPVEGVEIANVKFPDNVHGLIMRRLDGLDPSVQITAKVASVIGSSFAAPIIRRAFPAEAAEPNVDAYLETLERERLVAGSSSPEYAFTHALVEEAIYERLLVTQRKALHGRVAVALEEGATNEMSAPLLGHHWLQAGDEQRAGHYFGLAGRRAVHSGAYGEGLNFLTRALALTKAEGDGNATAVRDGEWHILRAEALFGLGQLDESSKAFRAAAIILGEPAEDQGLSRELLGQVSRRLLRGLATERRCEEAEVPRVRLLAICFEMLSLLDLFSNRMAASLSAALKSLNQAEQLGPSPEYARALATMALAASLVPARVLARQYSRAALQVAGPEGESTISRVREFIGMYQLGEGRWQESLQSFEQAIAGFRIVGDRRRAIECTCLLSTWNHYRGQFALRVEMGQQVQEMAIATGDLQAQAWGLLDQIESLLNLGDFARVDELGRELRLHLGQNIYGADEIMAYGLLALLELRTGRWSESLPFAQKALAVMTAVTPTIVYNLEAYAAVVECFQEAWRRTAADDSSRDVFAAQAREACVGLRHFAKVFPIGVPRSFLLSAAEAELFGDRPRAIVLTQKALRAGVQLEMPYEQALAHRQLARFVPEEARGQDGSLGKARDLFQSLEAKHELRETDALER